MSPDAGLRPKHHELFALHTDCDSVGLPLHSNLLSSSSLETRSLERAQPMLIARLFGCILHLRRDQRLKSHLFYAKSWHGRRPYTPYPCFLWIQTHWVNREAKARISYLTIFFNASTFRQRAGSWTESRLSR